MRLYRTAAGQWTGTQADARARAGKAGEEVDVQTDKQSLLSLLNTHAATAPAELAPVDDEPAPTPPAPRIDPNVCPKCSRLPRAAEQLAKGDDIDAIGDWLWQAAPWQVERVFAILGGRVAQLRDAAVTQ
jgi:hypothetical protein